MNYIIIYLLCLLGIVTNFICMFNQWTHKFYQGDFIKLIINVIDFSKNMPLLTKISHFIPFSYLGLLFFSKGFKITYSENWKYGTTVNNFFYEIKNVGEDLYEIRWTEKLVAYKHSYTDIINWVDVRLSYVTVEKEINNLIDIKQQFINKFKI